MAITYRPNTASYYDGTKKVDQSTINGLIEDQYRKTQNQMSTLAERYTSGSISTNAWQSQSWDILKEGGISQSLLGGGGIKAYAQNHLLAQEEVNKLMADSLSKLAQQASSGSLSVNQIKARATQLSLMTRTSYHVADKVSKKNANFDQGKRSLDSQSDPCPECIGHQQNKWVNLSDIIPQGVDCRCGGRCRCRISYRKSSKAKKKKTDAPLGQGGALGEKELANYTKDDLKIPAEPEVVKTKPKEEQPQTPKSTKARKSDTNNERKSNRAKQKVTRDAKQKTIKEPEVPSAPATLTKQSVSKVNPYADEGLTPQMYRDYVDKEDGIRRQFDKNAYWNMSYNEAKEINPGLSKKQYQSSIVSSIRDQGIYPSEASLNDLKLTKSQQKQIQDNKDKINSDRELVTRYKKAIQYETSSPSGWKPMMNREEAAQYVKGSFFGDMEFYHGNAKEVTGSIASEGSQPWRNTRGIYGQGTYFGIDRSIGNEYAATTNADGRNRDVSVITTYVRLKRPYITTTKEFDKLTREFAGNQSNGADSRSLTEFIKIKGYDGVYLKDEGYIVSLEQSQVITIEDNDFKGKELDKAITDFRNGTFASETHKQNKNAKTLNQLGDDEVDLTDPDELFEITEGWIGLDERDSISDEDLLEPVTLD